MSFTCSACRQSLEYREEVVAAPVVDGRREPFVHRSGDEVTNDPAEEALHLACYRELCASDPVGYPALG